MRLSLTYTNRYLSPAALAVAHALLLYDPKKRASASQALQMDYFTREQPRAVMPAG